MTISSFLSTSNKEHQHRILIKNIHLYKSSESSKSKKDELKQPKTFSYKSIYNKYWFGAQECNSIQRLIVKKFIKGARGVKKYYEVYLITV